jgi:hypothetical protein
MSRRGFCNAIGSFSVGTRPQLCASAAKILKNLFAAPSGVY